MKVARSDKDQNLKIQTDEFLIEDSELEKVLNSHRTVIRVIGTGGGGNNTLTRLAEVGVNGIETIAINTDAQDLLAAKSNIKILIGREITNGLGAGGDPTIGEQSARETEDHIRTVLKGSDMVFVTCGLGGGTGTGSAPVIAEIARDLGALTISVVTLPFTEEGVIRQENALQGLEKLRKNSDTVIVIKNDRLLNLVPDLPLNAAFKIADVLLVDAVKGITELVTEKGLVNLDFSDVKSVMKNGDTAMIGIGESDSDDRANDAVEKAINNPLLDIEITGARSALINVIGDESMTITDARNVMNAIAQKLDPKARIIWGARIDNDLDGKIKVLLIATGLSQEKKGFKSVKFEKSEEKATKGKKEEHRPPTIKPDDRASVVKHGGAGDKVTVTKPTFDIKNISLKSSKNNRVFNEIFEEEIRGDINILSEAVKNFDDTKADKKYLGPIKKACTSLQSSAQLFEYERIDEFITFVSDIVEGILAGEIPFKLELIPLIRELPELIDKLVADNEAGLADAQKFVTTCTRILSDEEDDNEVIDDQLDGEKLIDQDSLNEKLN